MLGCSIVLPYGVLLRTAFVKNWSGPVLGNFSLEHWRFVFFEFSQTKLALVQHVHPRRRRRRPPARSWSSTLGYLSLRKLVWGHRYLAFLATAPVAIPGIVLAVGLFLSYTQPPLVLYGTLVDHLPRVPHQGAAGRLPAGRGVAEERCIRSWRTRAASSARRGCARCVDITAPLIRNGVIATWIFIFIGSIRELSATILLFTARTKTISVTMFDLRESNDWGPIAVLSITMLVITFVMVAAINSLHRSEADLTATRRFPCSA